MTADELRAENAALDEVLLGLAASVTDDELPRDAGDGEWTVAENLGHLAEFPAFFADELARFLADPDAPVGRTHEHERRLAALAAAPGLGAPELVDGIRDAFARLGGVLDRLSDEHLAATMNNRKYGAEPVTAFFDRYVIGHKRAHIEQLERTLAGVRRQA